MEDVLWKELNRHSQRILSQVDRDPDSPTYGCFDRNYWNYKIRDFASIIQQQGILVLDVLYSFESDQNPYFGKDTIRNLIRAGVNFWSKSQLRTGAFNEYYPWESGFPPTAFSLYAVSLILVKYPEFSSPEIIQSINKAGKWLLNHPEKEALNQESAGLAGMTVAQKIPSVSIDQTRLAERLDAFYKAQTTEGWFNEYGGPDLGYLSVTVDSLWDIYQYSGDERALNSAKKAAAFMSRFVTVSGDFPVMINSRNTDYVVPYGLTGLAKTDPVSAALVKALLNNIRSEHAMYGKTDDRYLTHYVGQSYFRSLMGLKNISLESAETLPVIGTQYLKESRIFIIHSAEKSIIVALGKGGIVNEFSTKGICSVNYGWRVKQGKKVAVTHWQDADYRCNVEENGDDSSLSVEGNFTVHGYLRPSPFKHMVLRGLAFLVGNRLIAQLKSLLIFNRKTFPLTFTRKIEIKGNTVAINDTFSNPNIAGLSPAPHYSLRHVSSAGRFVIEEIL